MVFAMGEGRGEETGSAALLLLCYTFLITLGSLGLKHHWSFSFQNALWPGMISAGCSNLWHMIAL